MSKIRFKRNFFLVISWFSLTTVFSWGTTFSLRARADASCQPLLSNLSQHLQLPRGEVYMLHMTNYQANNQWWGGYADISLRRSNNGHLIAQGNRLISSRTTTLGRGFGQLQPFSIRQPEPITYDIDPQSGTITFLGQYGPYDMTCIGNKFAIVNTSDSLETFTFSKGFAPVVR
jgi:hypothetical protein